MTCMYCMDLRSAFAQQRGRPVKLVTRRRCQFDLMGKRRGRMHGGAKGPVSPSVGEPSSSPTSGADRWPPSDRNSIRNTRPETASCQNPLPEYAKPNYPAVLRLDLCHRHWNTNSGPVIGALTVGRDCAMDREETLKNTTSAYSAYFRAQRVDCG